MSGRDRVQILSAALASAVPWEVAYEAVERETIAVLSDPDTVARLHLEQQTLSTKELAELLWPEALARGDGITARKRLFKALAALATRGLSDYCTRGEPTRNKRLGRDIRPWRWHSKRERPAPPARRAQLIYMVYRAIDPSVEGNFRIAAEIAKETIEAAPFGWFSDEVTHG